MAALQQTHQSEALHKLEEQLTCSICLDQYNNPKILPCFHSFCFDCLKGIKPDQDSNSLLCPTCRTPFRPTNEQGIDSMPSSFTINNLTEVYTLMKKVTGKSNSAPPCDNCQKESDRFCKQCAKLLCQECLQQHDKWTKNHDIIGLNDIGMDTAYQMSQTKPQEATFDCAGHNKPLDIFCEECEELICQLCTVKMHKEHEYDAAVDAFTKHKQKIEQRLEPLDKQIQVMEEALANLNGRKKEIAEEGNNARQATRETIDRIKDLLDQTEHKLHNEIERVVEYKFHITDHQIKECEASLDLLREWKNHVQQSLKVDTHHQVLSSKRQMEKHTDCLITNVKRKTFQPIEKATLRLVRKDVGNIEEIPSYIGTIEYSTVTVDTKFDHPPIVGQTSTLNVSLSHEDGSPAPVPSSFISCYLTPPASPSSPVRCRVKDASQTVVFTPQTRGYHQLHVELCERSMLGSDPISIPVSVPVTMRGDVVKTITGFKKPYGVAVSNDGQVIVCEWKGQCITIVTRDGERFLRSFGRRRNLRGQFERPTGIAITSKGTLLVVDNGNHNIQEFTMDGECISCVGRKGNGRLQFNGPRGIAINKTTGQVYVVDTHNHRVQVLNADLTFSRMFGGKGSGKGQLSRPYGIAIDSHGHVYVAERDNNRIQKFTPEGQFVSFIGNSKGSKPGQLSEPTFLTIDDNDLLYVSEWDPNHRISVFSISGKHVHCFGNGSLKYPNSLIMDPSTASLFVCDDKDVVYVF